jgi:membrane protein implicated in regulation of membrane protease activity
MTYLAAFVVLALGIAGMVAGEADDSPGLQLIGVVLIVAAVALTVKNARRRRARS